MNVTTCMTHGPADRSGGIAGSMKKLIIQIPCLNEAATLPLALPPDPTAPEASPVRWLLVAALVAVCALPAIAADDAAARVTYLSGQVSLLKDNAPWVLNLGDAVQPQQIILTGPDGMADLKLADGSTFEGELLGADPPDGVAGNAST